ncbi:MAG: hypothetical protein WA964_06015 [Ilumatobacter sp.]|uniref:hypothetical protein n=1 Tax=Ilumatobacter sp. TaxID=1967498 RepID=UPI003C7536C7
MVEDLLAAPKLSAGGLNTSDAETVGFSLTGVARGAEGGIVTVEMEPTPDEMAAYTPGHVRASDYIAAAFIGDDLTYAVAVPSGRASEVGQRQLRITTLDRSGALIGVTLTEPEPTHEESRSVSTSDVLLGGITDDVMTAVSGGGTLVVDVAPLDPGSSASLINTPSDAAMSAARQPADPCGSTSCCRWYFQYNAYPRVTVATAGTNTRHADVSATYTRGSRSQLGWTLHVGGEGWKVGGGATTTIYSGVIKKFPPSNRYGLDSFKMKAQYAESIHWCWLNNGPGRPKTLRYDRTERRPVQVVAGSARQQWLGQGQFLPRNCLDQSAGPMTISSSKAMTYQGGVELSYVRASAQIGYSTSTSLTWDFKRDGDWLCGESAMPGLNGAGRMMADYKDR